jgi:hypothetical protein
VAARPARSSLGSRHLEFGRDAAEARERATGTDQRNAVLIEASRDHASLVVSLGRW